MPAKAGIQNVLKRLNSRFHGNDKKRRVRHLWTDTNYQYIGIHHRFGIKVAVLYYKINFRESIMKCHRCGGTMAYEKFFGATEDFFGWRCILCGEIVDQVILKNRYSKKH